MDEKIYLRLLYGMEEIPDGLARIIGRNLVTTWQGCRRLN